MMTVEASRILGALRARDPPVDASFVIASVFKELAANNRGPGGHLGEDALGGWLRAPRPLVGILTITTNILVTPDVE